MSNLASVLKKEISRLARKELKSAMEANRKTMSRYRSDIAGLKSRVKELEERLAYLEAQENDRLSQPTSASTTPIRFSPKSIRTHRKRLGLSAENYAKILGVSMQTVYHWDQGKSRPRQAQLQRLAAVRQMGKREARKRLAMANTTSTSNASKSAKKSTKKKKAEKKSAATKRESNADAKG